jgi:membrane associated rhomboid family serine protease
VPPLSSIQANGLVAREPWHLPLDANALVDHFVYSEEALKAGRWWTSFTYMFTHRDLEHMKGNLLSLSSIGYGGQ